MNILIGVMFTRFQIAEQKTKLHPTLSPLQLKWVELHEKILDCSLSKVLPPHNSYCKNYLYRLFKKREFNNIMLLFPIVTVLLFITYDENNSNRIQMKKHRNNVLLAFTLIYLLEIFFKIHAFSLKNYVRSPRLLIEFLIGVTNFTIVILEMSSLLPENFESYANIIRLSVIIRFFYKIKFLKKLAKQFSFQIRIVFDIFSLFFISLFIYGCVGCYFFESINFGKSNFVDENFNFENIAKAMLTLFICATGESWNVIMFDTIRYCEGSNCSESKEFFKILFLEFKS